MVVHVLISDEGKLLGLFTSGVDAHEVHKQYPRTAVQIYSHTVNRVARAGPARATVFTVYVDPDARPFTQLPSVAAPRRSQRAAQHELVGARIAIEFVQDDFGDLRGQLGKGAETLTSAIVGTPFLRSPEHAWRCDQR